MNFCSHCGQSLTVISAPEKSQPVFFCEACQHPFRQHPTLLVASFISCGNKLLWMRRALAPKQGFWAIPAGFMEQGETLAQAAARELREETGVIIAPSKLELYMIGTISFISEVYIAFHAEVESEYCVAGTESLEVGFFSRQELPWADVAYPEANNSIIQTYDNIDAGEFGVYHAQMTADKNDLLLVSP